MGTTEAVIDSAMDRTAALAQNPASIAPDELLEQLELLEITYVGFDGRAHKGQIVMHTAVASEVTQFFKAAYENNFPIEKVIPISDPRFKWDDEFSCDDNNSAGYNYRLVMGTTRLSNHARGLAFDINPRQNIYIAYDEELKETARFPKGVPYDPQAKGTLTSNHALVLLMKGFGWEWGGDWTPESGRVDYQHFEKSID